MFQEYQLTINGKVLNSSSSVIRCESTKHILGCLPKNYRDILYFLYSNKEAVISKQQLAKVGWKDKKIELSSVIVAISEIRSLIGQDVILTIRNEGYVFNQIRGNKND